MTQDNYTGPLVNEYLKTAESCIRIVMRELKSRPDCRKCLQSVSDIVKKEETAISFIREIRLAVVDEDDENIPAHEEDYDDFSNEDGFEEIEMEFDRRINGL